MHISDSHPFCILKCCVPFIVWLAQKWIKQLLFIKLKVMKGNMVQLVECLPGAREILDWSAVQDSPGKGTHGGITTLRKRSQEGWRFKVLFGLYNEFKASSMRPWECKVINESQKAVSQQQSIHYIQSGNKTKQTLGILITDFSYELLLYWVVRKQ